jgi:hypothetical protein
MLKSLAKYTFVSIKKAFCTMQKAFLLPLYGDLEIHCRVFYKFLNNTVQ